MKYPLISIIVPCYNQAKYLGEALQSVLEQNYTNWECIIVNDGSLDNTEEIAQQWVNKDFRLRYLYKENAGLSSARNYGIEHANGEFILPLDADDKIAPAYTLKAIESFNEDNSLKLVYCKAEKFGDEVGLWQLPKFSIIDLCRVNMIFCTAFFKKADWKRVGGYDTNLIYGLEDWEFWIAILKNGGSVKQIESIGFYYRIRHDSMARKISQEQREFSEKYVGKKHIDFLLSNYDNLKLTMNNLLSENIVLKEKFKSEKVLINELFFKIFGFKLFNLKIK